MPAQMVREDLEKSGSSGSTCPTAMAGPSAACDLPDGIRRRARRVTWLISRFEAQAADAAETANQRSSFPHRTIDEKDQQARDERHRRAVCHKVQCRDIREKTPLSQWRRAEAEVSGGKDVAAVIARPTPNTMGPLVRMSAVAKSSARRNRLYRNYSVLTAFPHLMS
jgi:hypothetical protein